MEKLKSETIIRGSELYPVNVSLDNIPEYEPFGAAEGAYFCDSRIMLSPDPLVSLKFDSVRPDDDPFIFKAYPVKVFGDSADSFEGLDSATCCETDITVKGNGNITFDFGVEFAAWLEIESPDLDGAANVTLSVSEYNLPQIVNRGPESPEKTANPVKISNGVYRLELNSELYEGVRFGFVHIGGFVREFHITSVRLICRLKPSNYSGSFSCDNEMLSRIWYTAAYVVRLNLKKDHIGAILIDRGDRYSWTGDAYISQAASLIAFGNGDFVLRNLKHTLQHPNSIESYELYWVLSLVDYCMLTGDIGGVRELIPIAAEKLEHAFEIFDSEAPLSFFGWDERQGAGFENPDIYENRVSYRALAVQAFRRFGELAGLIGDAELSRHFNGYAKIKASELSETPAFLENAGLHAFVEIVNALNIDKNTLNRQYEKHFTDRANRLSYCPFNEFFILNALAKMNRTDDAISSVLDLWGGQIENGATCFYEVFRPEWKEIIERNGPVPNNQAGYTSLAHPWSAGVLTFMSTELLGIKPLLPGFKRFSVTPHLGTLLTKVSGEVPTPDGTVFASFDVDGGTHRVKVPEGSTAVVGIPKAGKNVMHLTVNGKPAKADLEDGDFLYFDGLCGGTYDFKADYAGGTEKYREPETVYPARFIGFESLGDNDIFTNYGRDGYVLFGKEEKNSRLPDYVEKVLLSRGICIESDDGSLPQYATGYDSVCAQTITADIELKEKHRYKAGFYFRSVEGGRTAYVELFDRETLKLIAHPQIVSDYKGTLAVFEYDRSVRVRINHVRGDCVSISGIFFDRAEEPLCQG